MEAEEILRHDNKKKELPLGGIKRLVDSGLDNDDNDDAQPARRMEAEAVEAKSRSFRKSRIPVGVNACLRPVVRHAGGGTPERCFDIRSRRHLSFPPVQFVVIHFFRHGASHCDAGACRWPPGRHAGIHADVLRSLARESLGERLERRMSRSLMLEATTLTEDRYKQASASQV